RRDRRDRPGVLLRGVPAGRCSPPGDRGDGRLGRQVQPRDRRLPGPGTAADEVLPTGQPHRRSLRRPQPGVLVPAARGLRRVRGRGQVMTENTQTDNGRPKETPLHAEHAELGASFTDFGGWDMPLKYGSELAEHRAVRESAGIFDLSHMGEVRVTGADAAAFLDFALLAKYSIVKVGRAKYGLILDASGGVRDDLITYRLADDEFLVVPNAGNAPAVAEALVARAEEFTSQRVPGADVTVTDESADTSLVAVQGPRSEAVVRTVAREADQQGIEELGYYGWMTAGLATASGEVEVLLARTGYTGEDGFEIYLGNADAQPVWEALVAGAQVAGIELTPCGLASRDSLRLEAGMPLYGNEITLQTTPADIGMGKMAVNALKREH